MGSTGLSLADLPNIFIMIAAVIALFIMLVILLRNMEVIGIVGEGVPNDTWRRSLPPSRLLMQRVHIPFTFKVNDNSAASYNEINCSVTSSVRYWQGSWWGAPVRDLHAVLWGPFANLQDSFRVTRDGPHDEKSMKLHGEPLQLGPPPRGRYPLVVILAREEQSTDDLRPDDTVALISVVHIQDEQCSLPTGVIAQYLKQANGHLSCLKQLYMSTDGEIENGYNATPLCCVCASNPLSRALLPCRHACLCHACLPKLDKCPICRSNISSYFCIRNEEDLKQQNFPFNSRLLNLFHYH